LFLLPFCISDFGGVGSHCADSASKPAHFSHLPAPAADHPNSDNEFDDQMTVTAVERRRRRPPTSPKCCCCCPEERDIRGAVPAAAAIVVVGGRMTDGSLDTAAGRMAPNGSVRATRTPQ